MNHILSLQAFFVPEIGTKDTKMAAVVFELAPEWHIYWENPGDIGMSTTIEGVDGMIYPTPIKIPIASGMMTYGYEGTSIFFVENPKKEIVVRWLACKDDTCIPGKRTLPIENTSDLQHTTQLTEHWTHRSQSCSFDISHEGKSVSTIPKKKNAWIVGFTHTSLDILETKENKFLHTIVWKKRPPHGKLLWVQENNSCILSF